MTLNIYKYSPINVAKVDNILRSQYIIQTDDINTFLLDQEKMKGLVEFEGDSFIFEGITLDIKRRTINKTTITITYSKLDVNNLLRIMEEQNGTD